MNTIFFCGDVHGCFEHLIEAVENHKPAAIVLLGDLEAQRPLDEELAPILRATEIWWIPGNHDSDDEYRYRNVFGSKLIDRNLHGRVAQVAGITIAGLGGIFREEIWCPPAQPRFRNHQQFAQRLHAPHGALPGERIARRERLRTHRTSIFPDIYAALYGQHAEVLITHEAPSCHPAGYRELDELARSMGVKHLFHGHHHEGRNYHEFDEKLRFRAFNVGLRGITNIHGGIIEPAKTYEGLRGS